MRTKDKVLIARGLFAAKFLGKIFPLIVGWPLTNRCNYRCKYCDRWDDDQGELSTQQILRIIDELSGCGTRIIIFGGGEPLMVKDIGSIIDYCKDKGIYVGINTNGKLIPQKIEELRGLDSVRLSFDGPPEVNDFVRGKGAYDSLMRAVDALKKSGIPVKFNTTLTKYNIDSVDFILDKSRELNVPVKFQPVSYAHRRDKKIDYMFPPADKYKNALRKIISEKKRNKLIISSVSGLGYLCNWPDHGKFKECYADKIICRIGPKGEVFPCTMMRHKYEFPNCLELGFKKAFYGMPRASCNGCWCTATLELNCLLNLKLDSILSLLRFT